MSGVIVGKYNGLYLFSHGQQFVLIAAPTGSNKGVAVVIPNLLNYDDSVVVFDLKLENFRLTSRFRELHGQHCYLFAPFSEDRETHCWNMLDTVSRDPIFRIGDVLAIGQVFYPGDCDPREKFWNDNARNLFLAFVLYLMETPSLPCTLGEVLRQSSGKGRPLKDHIQAILSERAAGDNALSAECTDAFGRFLASPENTLGNIISTFNAPLLVFANPIVDAATSRSDFNLNDVRRQRISLYIGIQPSRLGDAALLVNMLFSRLIELNTKELPENNPELKYECLLIMDEFTALGIVKIIAKSNSYIRGYNLRLLTIIQSVAQLESVYGAADTRTLVTNHAVQILYPPREQKDAAEYSEILGYFTQKVTTTGTSRQRGGAQGGSVSENTSEQRRALMLPQELRDMPQHQQIIISESTKPILCDKARYYEDHRFLDRLKQCSPTLAALDASTPRRLLRSLGLARMSKVVPTERQIKHVAFVLRELSAPVPILDIGLHRAKIEHRVRALQPGETIDLAALAIDTSALPPLDGDHPSPETVSALVDSFFGQLAWEDTGSDTESLVQAGTTNTVESSGRPSDEDDVAGQPDGHQVTPAATVKPASDTKRRRLMVDLSALDGDTPAQNEGSQHD